MSNHKYGRKPPKNAPALKLGRFLKSTAIPDHPATVDYGTKITDWKMLGNDQYGDCVAVAWANNRYLVSTYLDTKAEYPTQDQVYAFYKTQNPNFPNQDEGMEIQTALEYLQKTGGPDGVKAVAFAKLDVTNIDEIRAAVAIFGSVIYGITVTSANETEFDKNQPWDYVRNSQNLGGHGIAGTGYTPDVRFVTWAEETEFTDAFIQHQMEEAWVVIYPEHLGAKAFEAGIDVTQLAADFKELTGKDLPVPTPTPTPEPTPAPAPTPVPGAAPFLDSLDPVVAQHIRNAMKRAELNPDNPNDVIAWFNHRFDVYFKIKG